MLIRFSVQNYRSFKEQQIFSMAAGKHTRHKGHVYDANGKRLLKGSIIFGANAGGKTNLIRAIQFGRRIALGGLSDVNLANQYYRIEKECASLPGIFQYDFYANNKFYSYGFAISYCDQVIESEWLYEVKNDGEICIFERNKGEKIKSEIADFFPKEIKNRFYIYADDVKDKNTFLAEIINKKLDKDSDFAPFFDVGMWLANLIFIFPKTRIIENEVYKSVESQNNLATLLKYFDTGIEGISGKELNAEEALSFLPNEVRDEILNDINNELSKGEKKNDSIDLTVGGKRFSFKLLNGELKTRRLFMDHGNKLDYFDFEDESDGTKRLFDLIPIYEKAKQECVIFVDELDRSFHSKLTLEFINKFYEKTYGKPSQLIATLHDSTIMDLDLLRQDEIWFVERNKHCSEIFSLNKFKERFDKDVAKEYIQGRYGAIPCFSDKWSDENE